MTDNMSCDSSPYNENLPAENPPAEAAVTPVHETVYSVKESVFALIFSFAGYFFIKLFLLSDAGIGAAVYMLSLAAASAVFMKLSGAKRSRYSTAYFITAVIFSLNIGITANGLMQFLDFVFAAAMFSMWAFAVNNPSYNGAEDSLIYCFLSAVFAQPFGSFGKCPAAALSLTKKSRFGKNIQNALTGILIAVPVTITVTAILSSADDNFGEIMGKISSVITENFLGGILKYALGLPVSFFIFGMLYSAAANKSEARINLYACSRNTASVKIAPEVMMYASVVPLCAVYVIFFFSQLSYFTSAFGNVLPEAFSAAEYARKGFFELCAVSVINLFVIITINLFCRYKDDGKIRPAALKFFTALLSVFTIILIATALSKMFMYISRFGLTKLRVYTSWFMIALGVLFALTAIRQYVKFNMAKIGTIIFTIMLAALSFCQTDALIAGYNINAYLNWEIEDIDFEELSPDAIYAVLPCLNSENEKLRTAAERFIADCKADCKYTEQYAKSLSEFIAENAKHHPTGIPKG